MLVTILAIAVAGPRVAAAQTQRRIGVVTFRGGVLDPAMSGGIRLVKEMNELGYREGRNLVIHWKVWQKPDEVPDMVRELVQLKTEVIVAAAPPSILAARSVTDRVPIVMFGSADPVATGLVKSLRRPGGNLTGLTYDHGFETYTKPAVGARARRPGDRVTAI